MSNFRSSIDGYQIDLSAGLTTNQVLGHNGTKIVGQAAPGGLNEVWWSSVDLGVYYVSNGGSTTTNATGGGTWANRFYVSSNGTCTGVKFYWAGPSSLTIRLGLWNMETSTELTTVDVAVSGTGTYTGTFSASQSLNQFVRYGVSAWETTNTDRTYFYDNNSLIPTSEFRAGTHIIITSVAGYNTGSNAVPSSTDRGSGPTEKYAIMPIFTVP